MPMDFEGMLSIENIGPKTVRLLYKELKIKTLTLTQMIRDAAISKVGSILNTKELTKEKLTQLWKALFYCFWMCDKVLIQQELARQLSNFVKLCRI